MIDVYYFYHGVKPNANQVIVCMNNNTFDLDKENLSMDDKQILTIVRDEDVLSISC
jgi:hypothetical protein